MKASLAVFFFFLITYSEGLNCYTCVGSSDDDTCVTDPASVENGTPITDCEQGSNICCTIVRQEYNEELGEIVSFQRGCIEDCEDMDDFEVTMDATSTFYNTYCFDPLCNTGDGDTELGDESGNGDGSNIIAYIPGNGAPEMTPQISLTVFITFYCIFIA